jgi:predicted anti-sigma-YlaC factor YlaD
MAGRPMPFRNPAGHAGLRQNLTSLVASLTQFVESRFHLAAGESKAALLHLLTLVACVMAAIVRVLSG